MREAVARNAPSLEKPHSGNSGVTVSVAPDLDPDLDIQPIALQGEFRPRPDDRYHVNDLLQFNDRQFVLNAYRAILKRPADESGYHDFLESLRSGELNKIDVLARLRFSEEGKQRNVQVDGLSFPATMRRVYRLPLIGYIANLVAALVRLPKMQRSHREFEAHTLAQSEILVSQINHIGRSVTDFARRTSVLLAERASLIAQLSERHSIASSTLAELEERLIALDREQASNHELFLSRVADLSSYFEDRLNDESVQRQEGLATFSEQLSQSRERTEALRSQMAEAGTREQELHNQINELRNRSAEIGAGVDELGAKVDQTRSELSHTLAGLTASSSERFEKLAGELAGEVNAIRLLQKQFTTELVAHGQRVARLLDRSDLAAAPEQMQHERGHLLDAFYASFDDQFRGDPDEIKRRLTVYVPYIMKAREKSNSPVIDVGSGRGEWLELMKERNIPATGIELNNVLVGQNRDRGLEVIEGDLLSYLHGLAAESVSAVTGFHVAEHLSTEDLVDFLGEASRVLCRGGVLILETPNPRNVLVGSCNFYFDPTHRNPLPDEVLKFLVESRGFAEVEVLPLNPSDEQPVTGHDELTKRFNQYFYGPMDYGLVGWKP